MTRKKSTAKPLAELEGEELPQNRSALVEAARLKGMSNGDIVRVLAQNVEYPELRALAEKWAKILGITEHEFIRMAGARSL